jgi:hypothetical protein
LALAMFLLFTSITLEVMSITHNIINQPMPLAVKCSTFVTDSTLPEDNPLYDDHPPIFESKRILSEALTKNGVYGLLGASGVGKTSLLFLLGAKQYIIFISLFDRYRAKAYYGDGMRALLTRAKDSTKIHDPDLWKEEVIGEVYARYLALLMMLMMELVRTPEEWLIAQIDGYADVVSRVCSSMLEVKVTLDDLNELLETVHELTQQEENIFCIDEAHLLCDDVYGTFVRPIGKPSTASSQSSGDNSTMDFTHTRYWQLLQVVVMHLAALPLMTLLGGTH